MARIRDAETDQAPEAETPPEAAPSSDAPDTGPASAATGGTRRYRMLTGVGSTRRGEEFEATPDDRRVTSGWAVEVEDNPPPDEVAAAFDSKG